jgi:glycosyltransferase involved in cell wall biosynthesis
MEIENQHIQLSIVVPLFNEEESIGELTDWIDKVCTENNFNYEVIMVDDGSTDKSWKKVEELMVSNNKIKGISFRRNYGKSAALNVAFEAVKGDVVITMDADLQDSPDEIPELYQMVKEEGFDIVSGWKKKRYDPITKTIPTKLYNAATRRVSGIKLHDMNCGLKAYKKEVVKSIEVYGEMHRYIPVIAKWAGFNNIGEKVVQHQERKYGKTKFGLERFLFGFLDLFSITFIGRFGKRPMHFFGTIGTLMFVIGFCFSLWIGIDKLFIDKTGTLIASRPSFYIAMTCMVLGVQMFLAGFLGEMLARNSPNRNNYLIKAKTSNLDD